MAAILHPTRGGKSSYANQDYAISLARAQGRELVLLYVSNVQFLNTVASPVSVDLVAAELDELGEFMLAMAQERAERAGVSAALAIRQGRFDQAIREVIQSSGVSTVVLGSPADDAAVTTAGYLQELIRFLRDEAAVEVIIVHEGKVVEQHLPD